MYIKKEIPFDNIPQLSGRDKAYQREEEKLRPFYRYEVSLEAFTKVIQERKKAVVNRELLVDELRNQYNGRALTNEVKRNIDSLISKDSFTIHSICNCI